MHSNAQYNIDIHVPPSGEGAWRKLYLQILEVIAPQSVVEIGAGSPDFLINVKAPVRCAIDAGTRWEQDFHKQGIDFVALDLDSDTPPNMGNFDVAVCSDVFEHLMNPSKSLEMIKCHLNGDGMLLSHVPNEFGVVNNAKIMLGLSGSVIYHPHCKEHNNPHLRRFTKKGYLEFLQISFKYNIFLSDIRYSATAKLIQALGINVPYMFEPGPTYISTNDKVTYEKYKNISNQIMS